MSKKKKIIVNDTVELQNHLLITNILLGDAKYLSYNANAMLLCDNETTLFIKHNQFLVNVRKIFFRQCIIELYKLFSNSDDDNYCISKLLNFLLKDSNNPIWGGNIPIDDIQILLDELDTEANQKRVKDIRIIRNTLYAHTAKTRPKSKMEVLHTDISVLIEFGERVVDILSKKIWNRPMPKFGYVFRDARPFLDKCITNQKELVILKLKHQV